MSADGLRTSEQALCDELNRNAMIEFNRTMAARRMGFTPVVVQAPISVEVPPAVEQDTAAWNPPPTPAEGLVAVANLQAHLDATRHQTYGPPPDEAGRRQRLREALQTYHEAYQAFTESKSVVANSAKVIASLQTQLQYYGDWEQRCAVYVAERLQQNLETNLSDTLLAEEIELNRLSKQYARHKLAHERITTDFQAIERRALNAERERLIAAGDVAVLRVHALANRLEKLERQAAADRRQLIAWGSVQQPNGAGPMLLPAQAYGLVHSVPVNAEIPLDTPDLNIRNHWAGIISVLADNADADVLGLREDGFENAQPTASVTEDAP